MSYQESTVVPDRVGAWLSDSSNRSTLLLVPLILYELLFFLIPLIYLFRLSVSTGKKAGIFSGGLTLESYVSVINSPLLVGIIQFTIKFTIAVTVVTLALAIFMSYAMWRASGIKRTILIFSIVFPLLTTLIVRLFATFLLLSPIGPVNEALQALGVIETPILMINNFFGTTVGQVYTAMPYATLAIFAVMSTIDWDTVESARDLGASRIRAFYEVVLPQTLPGITVGLVITFAWGVGAYAAPAVLGSPSQTTFAMEVERIMLRQFNWPKAAAMSVFLLGIVLLTIFLMFGVLNRIGGEEMDV